RFFAARVLPPPAVAVLGSQPFIEDALEVLAEAGRIRRATSGADVAILPAGVGAESFSGATALVILPPASATELPAANRRLAAAGIPWRFEAPATGESRFAPEQEDALLRGLADARVRQFYPLTRTNGSATDSVLIRMSDGGAWAVRGTRSVGGAYVVLASPLTAEASTIPTSALMVPLLDRITAAWARAVAPRTDLPPATEIALPSGATTVERPDGTRDDVTGSTTYRLGVDPGVYRVLAGDST